MKLIIVPALALALSACASRAVQTEDLLKADLGLPPVQRIENVPFIEQKVGHCGPATLTMALRWAGRSVDVDEIAKQVYVPGAEGSLQSDLIGASRRQGMMAVPLRGFPDLMKEIAAGHPVIIFENLALNWAPQWHYAVVFGYDLPAQEVLMHSGPEAFKRWDMATFERSWMLGDYWGLVVLPPDRLSASGDELAHVTAAAGLEQVDRTTEAGVAYRKILERWPTSLGALVGSANVAFAKGDTRQAVTLLEQATKAHPTSATAWHNRAVAEGTSGRKGQASRSARQALSLAGPTEKPLYLETLKKWMTPSGMAL